MPVLGCVQINASFWRTKDASCTSRIECPTIPERMYQVLPLSHSDPANGQKHRRKLLFHIKITSKSSYNHTINTSSWNFLPGSCEETEGRCPRSHSTKLNPGSNPGGQYERLLNPTNCSVRPGIPRSSYLGSKEDNSSIRTAS